MFNIHVLFMLFLAPQQRSKSNIHVLFMLFLAPQQRSKFNIHVLFMFFLAPQQRSKFNIHFLLIFFLAPQQRSKFNIHVLLIFFLAPQQRYKFNIHVLLIFFLSTTAKIQAIEAKLRLMEQTQKDFGVDATIKAPPGYVPLSTSHSKRGHSNSSSSRPTPYRRSQPSFSRPKQRRR